MITSRRPGSPKDNQVAESGTIEVTVNGVVHSGSYVVHAQGRGRARYTVTYEKGITVNYRGLEKHTTVGTGGAGTIARVLLLELVDEIASGKARAWD